MNILSVSFAHPHATALNDRVQREYVERYGDGDGDATPLDPAMFEPPRGLYLIGYEDGTPVATGGWRAMAADELGHADGDAELKRMYVVPEARGRGLSRLLLAVLEADARAAGRIRMVLETGTEQPEAIALYTSSGYEPCTKFGIYRDDPRSRCFAKPLTPADPVTGAAPSITLASRPAAPSRHDAELRGTAGHMS